MGQSDTITVAAAQLPAHRLDQADQALAAIERAIGAAAQAGADLVVLPECAYPAYGIGSVAEYRRADVLSSDDYLNTVAHLARSRGIHVVSGFVEDLGSHMHNSAALFDDQGRHIGTYRKSFLWAKDNEWFKPGECVPVFDTQFGKIGMVICADTRAPELVAKLVLDGARVVAMPTCWINTAAQRGGYENPQPEYLIRSRAREFGVPFVCANKFGMETDTLGYCGRSIIASADGAVLQEAGGDGETVLVDQVRLRDQDGGHRHGELWQALLSWETPIRPAARGEALARVAVWPGRPVEGPALKALQDQGIRLLLANALVDERLARVCRMDVVLPHHIGAMEQFSLGRVGCLRGEEFRFFGRARLLALGGAEIICVFDAPQDLPLLRTRAVENRTFILAINQQLGAVISPAGDVLVYSSAVQESALIAEIDMAKAAMKDVAPDTDIWEQRRVSAYMRSSE